MPQRDLYRECCIGDCLMDSFCLPSVCLISTVVTNLLIVLSKSGANGGFSMGHLTL